MKILGIIVKAVIASLLIAAILVLLGKLPTVGQRNANVVQYVATPMLQTDCPTVTAKTWLSAGGQKVACYGKTRVEFVSSLPGGGKYEGQICTKSCVLLRINGEVAKFESGDPNEVRSLTSGTTQKSANIWLDGSGVTISVSPK